MNIEDREGHISEKLRALSLADKVRLLTGETSWRLHTIDHIGLRGLLVSDGPAGIRGVTDNEIETGASFPSPTALAATWDIGMAERLGEVFAAEARRHNVDVVLGPVVNLQRTPVGGRHFECFSEDPLLSGNIAATLVSTMQRHGVGACVKHFVANDSETARTEYVARMDDRTLREVYLAPFETVVREAKVWSVMAAYNGVETGGESNPASDHHYLQTQLLKNEWGFDGVVVSDWTAATTTAQSANAGLDLVMPGPGGPWEDALLKAVRRGEVDEAVIDDKVERILRLAYRSSALTDAPPSATPPAVDVSATLRELAARSIVVLKNDHHLLPKALGDLSSLALIGPNAVDPFLQGGGSCYVRPDHIVTPEQGLRTALGPDRRLSVHRGGNARPHMPKLDLDITRQPDTDAAGLCFDFADATGQHIQTLRRDTDYIGWVRHVVPQQAAHARLRTRVWLAEPGRHWLGVATVGVHRIWVNGELVASGDEAAHGEVVLDSSVNSPPSVDHPVDITEPGFAEIEADLQIIDAYGWGRFLRAELRHSSPGPTIEEEIVEAVEAAKAADVALVVVGTSVQVESEGWDRSNLDLPGRQDELVRRVAAVNPNTIVVVNAGAPVLLPWLDEVNCVLWNWFPGQECGDALADVVFGRVEPAGRLPWTLPASFDDVPVKHAKPDNGIIEYTEGIHIGYRSYVRDGITPAAAFGHGLGWTDWQYHDADVSLDADGSARVTVTVENSGSRHGREVVQVYASAESGPERPARWLAGFATVEADAGVRQRVEVQLRRRVFEIWDAEHGAWQTPPGRYHLHIGRSIQDVRLTRDLTHV